MRPLPAGDEARVARCLDRLLPHVRPNGVAVTGGLGIDLGLAALGHPATRGRLTDLDLVATDIDAVAHGVVGPFLVSHFHRQGPGIPRFMVQLVDPLSRLRVDIFPDLAGSIAGAWTASLGGHRVPVLPLQSILDHKIQTLTGASAARPVDPKHADDVRVLGRILQQPVPAIQAEALVPEVYGLAEQAGCRRCELSRDVHWPLAPGDQVCELLGWVEAAAGGTHAE